LSGQLTRVHEISELKIQAVVADAPFHPSMAVAQKVRRLEWEFQTTLDVDDILQGTGGLKR